MSDDADWDDLATHAFEFFFSVGSLVFTCLRKKVNLKIRASISQRWLLYNRCPGQFMAKAPEVSINIVIENITHSPLVIHG